MSDRINAYTTPVKDGIHFDAEGMAVDLVMMCKASGMSYAVFMKNMGETWRAVNVEVKNLGETEYHKPERNYKPGRK